MLLCIFPNLDFLIHKIKEQQFFKKSMSFFILFLNIPDIFDGVFLKMVFAK